MSYERHPLEMDPSVERCLDCGNGLDYCDCPDAEKQQEFRARCDELEAKVDAAKAAPWYDASDALRADRDARTQSAIAAADAHDAAHNVHRVVLDDATVERAARALAIGDGFTDLDWTMVPSRYTKRFYEQARAVLSAAVKEEGR